MMQFDTSISLGNVLTIGAFLVFVTLYIANARNMGKLLGIRLDVIDKTMAEFKEEMKKLADVTVKQAAQGEQINTLDARLLNEGKRFDEMDRRLNRYIERSSEQGRHSAYVASNGD